MQHGGLARSVDRPASPDERAGEPAAGNRSHVGDQVDHDERERESAQRHAVPRIEKLGKPIEIEEPDRIGEQFPYRERPGLPASEETDPWDGRFGRVGAVAPDVAELFLRHARVQRRVPIQGHPERHPEQADRAGDHERPLPSPPQRDGGTVSGATIAPVLVAAFTIPAASARSRFGNHSAIALESARKRSPIRSSRAPLSRWRTRRPCARARAPWRRPTRLRPKCRALARCRARSITRPTPKPQRIDRS